MESMDVPSKKDFVAKKQSRAVISALSIAVFANKTVGSFLGKYIVAGGITIASGMIASSFAIQYYKFPPVLAQTFGNDKAVCLSFVYGASFFVCSPTWAVVSKIVTSDFFGSNGWTIAWLMLSALFAGGNVISRKTLPVMLGND